MQINSYGRSGLRVSALGLGAGQIGDASLDDDAVGRLLNTALDLGITLIDTARGYGLSEDRIGRHIGHRRSQFVLSTKVGYGIPGFQDWTGAAISEGIEAALRLLRTDVLDIVHLHSCGIEMLRTNEVVEALLRAREQGKLRCVAYSGENQELSHSLDKGCFDGVECSVNVFDQGSLAARLPQAQLQGMGVIAKRPLGNAPWRFSARPVGDYAEVYWLRMQELGYSPAPMAWDELALRFAAFAPGVSSAITGTASIGHLRQNVELVERGPLPEELFREIERRYRALGSDWPGEI
jgi:aryl-alcohol dehydrogenase-like predicted oxidoreductase